MPVRVLESTALLVCRDALTDGKAQATSVLCHDLAEEAANVLSLSTVRNAMQPPAAYAILL